MSTSHIELINQLKQLFSHFINKHRDKYQCLPKVEFDKSWLSQCQVGDVSDDYIEWQPIECNDALSFTNIEQALDCTINAEFAAYFTSFYSESIPAECSEGYLELLFAWNKDDFDRLQQNMIGHILMKQKLKQSMTLFFAVTDEEDVILTVRNETGEVWAERVGSEPHKKLANSIYEFISTLEVSL